MDWTALAITRNREALLRLLAMWTASVERFAPGGLAATLQKGGTVVTLPRYVRSNVLRLLRPAESATRRLIVVMAYVMAQKGFVVTPRPARPAPAKPIPRGTGQRAPCFRLIDPRKRFGLRPKRPKGPGPRIIALWDDPSLPLIARRQNAARLRAAAPPPPPSPDDPVDAQRLCRRLQALKRALNDLPAQARRLARLRARPGKRLLPPMRPGWPPGHRTRPINEVDEILSDCHALAFALPTRPPP